MPAQRFAIAGCNPEPVFAVTHELRDPARAGPDDRKAEAHGFEGRDAEALVGKGHGEHVAAGVNRFQPCAVQAPPEYHLLFQAMFRDDRACASQVATVRGHVAHEGEPPHLPREARQADQERGQPLDGRQVPDEQQFEGTASAAPFGDEAWRGYYAEAAAGGAGHAVRPRMTEQLPDLVAGGGAVENEGIHRLQITALHLAVNEIEPPAARLAAENLVDDAHDGGSHPAANAAVEAEEGGVDERILQDEVPGVAAHPVAEPAREIVEEAFPVMSPGQADHRDPVAPALQGVDQVPVVEEPAGQGLQAPVQHQRYAHAISSV